MVQTHEYNVNNNTESDEELCEGVKHNDREHLRKKECYGWILKYCDVTSAVLIQSQQQSQTHITSEVRLMQSNMMSFIFGPSSSSSWKHT